MAGFIKYMRTEEAEFLLSYPNANHLFQVMAFRARRTDHPMNGLKAGQCFLGDFKNIGLTERQYRTAKKQLTEWGLATFKGTNKGTVATLVNSKVYDINEDATDRQATDKGQAGDGHATTNKECKKERMEEVKEKLDWSATQMSAEEIQEIKRIRKSSKADVSQRVINQLAKQFELSRKRGFTNDDILNEWSIKGWRSYKDEWMKGNPSRKPEQQLQIEIDPQQQRDELSQMFRSMGGDK